MKPVLHDGHELTKNAVKKAQVLFVSTSHGDMPDGRKTGVWASELAGPYFVLEDNGYDITIASIAGGNVPVDPDSLDQKNRTPEVDRFWGDAATLQLLEHSVPLSQVKGPEAYAAIYLPGGHGASFDMPNSKELADLLSKAYAAGKLVTAVCHGVAGMVGPVDAQGRPLVAGKKLCCFSNSEERSVNKAGLVPFLLEDRLKELGAAVEESPTDWVEHTVQDGIIITGQNPASSEKVATLIVETLSVAAG